MKEFAIITGLKCSGNIKNFTYPDSKRSRLVQRYFPGSNYSVNKQHLVDRFMLGGWDDIDDQLQMVIMFFIHSFVLSQLGTTAIPIEDFLMVEDGTYRQYPWGQRAFRSLMNSLRQEFKSEKKMYRLNGISYALNVWIYECAFVLDNEIAVKEQNVIPRICNWKVVAEKPKFEMFMESVFTEHNCTNIQPTGEECTALQLPQPSHVTHDEPGTSNVNIDVGKPQEVTGFEDFSSEPPDQLLRRSTRVSSIGTTPPPKRRKVVHPHKTKVFKSTTAEKQPTQNVYTPDLPTSQVDNVSNVPVNSDFRKVDQQVGCLVELIKKNDSELMKVVGEKDNKTEKTDKVDQQSVSPNHMDCSKEQHMEDAVEVIHSPQRSHVLIEKVALNNENDYTTGEASHSDTKILNADEHDVDTLQHNIEKHTTSLFSVDTSTEVENNAQPLCLMSHVEQNESAFWLSDSQLPVKKSSLPPDTETPAPRHRMPSRILRSSYLTNFGSNDKGKAKIDDDVLPLYLFEGCGFLEQLPLGMMDEFSQWIEKGLLKSHANKKQSEDKYREKSASFGVDYIDFVVTFPMDKNWLYTMSQPNRCWTDEHIDVIFYYLRKKSKQRSMDQYRYTTINCLFKSHINKAYSRYYNSHADDTISTQEHMIHAAVVSVHERSIINIINGFSIPAALPWHLVNEVYIPVNCDENFHWVLAVVVLKERLIRVYDSTSGSRKRVHFADIKKLSQILPNYLHDSGFFEKKERTDWAALDAYKDMKTGELLGPQHSFNVEFAQDNMQQISDSLDCGLFVAVYAEFLSDKINMSCNSFESSYLRKRYVILLLKYGLDKMNAGYVSNSDDPPRMKNVLNPSSEDEIVNVG
ncbi:uncharacterized protein [Solanum lycopersicum]|uniref:uncharacterized protein n=1 Tax=Solanum lycopersicum TaxID=4081 RepID=UPI0037485DD2